MGFFKGLVGMATGKSGYFKANANFTVRGDIAEIRKLVLDRCTNDYHSAVAGTKNTKEKWLTENAVKYGRVKTDTASPMSFNYVREFEDRDYTCHIAFVVFSQFGGTATVNIEYLMWCSGGEREVQEHVDIIKEAITDKFPQQ